MDIGNETTNASTTSSNGKSDKRTYTVMEIAALLRISKTKAYELCTQELFRTIHIGRAVRISKSSFDKWLDNQTK
ncbi:MAG: helix-turn-helix domain-containing protein [Clostridiales bacterium]|jgi:excisionase family DNA binding protein|nr:helix-turn-helix domain-containing protein [Clostridiales bacterium]